MTNEKLRQRRREIMDRLRSLESIEENDKIIRDSNEPSSVPMEPPSGKLG
jgi:hypothetical protein